MADDPTPPGRQREASPGDDGTDAAEKEATDATDGDPDVDPDSDPDGIAIGDLDDGSPVDATEVGEDTEGTGDEDAHAPEHDEVPGGHDEVSGGSLDAPAGDGTGDVPADVRKYQRFKKVDGAQYDRVNEFLRERTYVTAREWAMARLCADFRTETGVEMTKIGENLPELVPFMEDTYSPQAVNQARHSFEEKVTKAGATFLYGAMCDFFTAEELDELMYEVTEVAKFLLEVEGIDLSVEEELEAEDRISAVMREVRAASEALRYEECPHCGEHLRE